MITPATCLKKKINYQILTIIIEFLGLLLIVWQLNYQTRSDIKAVETRLENRINQLENRFKNDIKELKGLMLGLYSPRLLDKIDKKGVLTNRK